MNAKAAIYAILNANGGANTLLSKRIYPGQAPAGVEHPYAVTHTINGTSETILTGDAGVELEIVQIDAWADTPAEAEAVGRAINDALRNASGVDTPGGWVDYIEYINGRDETVNRSIGSESPIHGRSLDFRVYLLN